MDGKLKNNALLKDYYDMQFINPYRFKNTANEAFIFTINTALGDGIASFTLPLKAGANYNMVVYWGDGNQSTVTAYDDAEITHNYSLGGFYQISIHGICESWYFNNAGDKLKFLGVDSWGNVGFKGLYRAFMGCSNIDRFPDGADINIFNNIERANQFLLFAGGTIAINNYNFYDCSISFISNSTITSFSNNNLGNPDLFQLFHGVSMSIDFDWNQILVPPENLSSMFAYGSKNINHLNISNVDFTQLTEAINIATNANALKTIDYDTMLITMASQSVQLGVTLSSASKYTLGGAAEAARDTLINTYGWTITDGGGV